MSAGLVPVPFHGGELLAVAGSYPEEGDRPIPLRPFCDRLGVAMQAQLTKLKSKPWAVITMIVTTGADGKSYEMACLPLRALPMWLATIEPNRVKPEVRAMLVAFQREATEVLYKHFAPRLVSQPAPAPQIAGEPAWAQDLRAQIAVMQSKLTLLTGRIDDPEHDGQIGPERAACIRRQLIVFGQLMGHGDSRSAKSWRTMGDNELRVRLDHPRSKGRPWGRLPVGKYGTALATLEEMLTRARKVDVAHLEASQLPLKTG